jgi:hypothetical protein
MELSTLRSSARAKADEESTGFISNDELNRYLNQGLRLIYGKIAERFEDYFIVPGTALNGGLFSTVAGTQGYSLPTTMQKLVRVEYRDSSSTNDDDWMKIARGNIGNENRGANYSIGDSSLRDFDYFIAGDMIYLRPVPQSVYSVRLWFIPRVTELSSDADVPGVPAEYHELIAEYGAIQCLGKSGEGLYKERSDVFKLELDNMIETISHRDQQPEQMVITEQNFSRRLPRYVW